MPHGHCYLWDPGVLWLNVVCDGLIAVAYYCIPFLLVAFVRKRKDLTFGWMFKCFAVFIIACGTTHLMEIYSIWVPAYWLAGVIKGVTAIASVTTAILLARLMPQALAIPSPTTLRNANEKLQKALGGVATEITARKQAEQVLRQRNERLQILSDCLAHLLSERDPGQLLSNLFPGFSEQVGADKCISYLVQGERELVLYSQAGFPDKVASSIRKLRFGEAPCGLVAENRAPLVLENIPDTCDPNADFPRSIGSQSYVGLPLLIGDRLLGTLSFASSSKPRFSPSEIEFLQLIAGYVAIAMDRARADGLIQESERRFREIANTVPARIFMTDAQGLLSYCTAQTERFYGLPLSKLLGLAGPPAVHPEDYESSFKLWLDAFRQRLPIEAEFRQRRADGQWRWTNSQAVPRFSDDGVFLGYIGIMMDVTERRAAETALMEAKRVAEEANGTKDEFIAALSHELRTPLTPVLMTAASLESDDNLGPDLHEQATLIRHNVELEARLIDDLLDLTKITRAKFSLRPENVEIHEILERTMGTVREDVSLKQIELRLESDAERTTAHADPARLQQVFWNLLNNAIKFTPARGTIHIRTFNPTPQNLAIEIRDTGVGIAPELREKIFLPFEQGAVTGNHNYGGLGLGLAISKAIVDLHGGSLSVASAGQDRGATFTVSLPVCSPEPTPRSPTRPPGKIEPMHILLVEDNEATRTVLSRLLSRDGHQVKAAATCAAALESARIQPSNEPFQVLISDLGLPDGSGLRLVHELKARIPALTAIALSGYGTEEDIRKSLDAGFKQHLTKPICMDDVRRALAV